MKPIEPGCLAVVIGHEVPTNNGKVVKVLTLMGNALGIPTWSINEKLKYCFPRQNKVEFYPFCAEPNLFRVDGFDPDAEEATGLQDELYNEQPLHALDAE